MTVPWSVRDLARQMPIAFGDVSAAAVDIGLGSRAALHRVFVLSAKREKAT